MREVFGNGSGPFLEEFIQSGLFSREDVKDWIRKYNQGKPIRRISDVADMLADFLYRMTRKGKPIITKQQTIEAKQYLLKGLTMRDIAEISSSVEYNPGLEETVRAFREHGIAQTLFSDSLGPHITYQRRKLGMDAGKGVPPVIELPDGTETEYEDFHLDVPDAKLTGRVLPFKKAEEFFGYVKLRGIDLSRVAVIDDSAENIESLFKPVLEAGGIAIAYNPTDTHRKKLRESSIPILKGLDLRAFAEIVLNPNESVIGRYCE